MTILSPLASPSATREVLAAHGLSAKYALGQNFLVNDGVLQKILALSEVSSDDYVLEVGPGIGTLTIALLKHAGRVVSVERDADLPAVLAETLAPWKERFALVEKDALDFVEDDLRDLPWPDEAADSAHRSLPAFPDKLVANLPYAVAATLVLDYFQRFPSLGSATVMVQKEVADRMAAQRGTKNYGAYTVKLSLFAQPAGRFSVGPGCFLPPPRVESAVLRLDRRTPVDGEGHVIDPATVRAACTMADASFANRRKTIANSCKTFFGNRGDEGARVVSCLPLLFERAGVDPRIRGEALPVEDFIRLGKALLEIVGL